MGIWPFTCRSYGIYHQHIRRMDFVFEAWLSERHSTWLYRGGFSNDGLRYTCPQISSVDNFAESDRIAIQEFTYH